MKSRVNEKFEFFIWGNLIEPSNTDPTLSPHAHTKEKALKNRASVSASIEGKKKKRTTAVIRFFFLWPRWPKLRTF